jgi:hypothetical protein
MVQPSLLDVPVEQETMCAKLAALFQAHPGRKFSWRELANVAGGSGWRTRVSNLRKAPWHLKIENAWWNVTTERGTYRESVYWLEKDA